MVDRCPPVQLSTSALLQEASVSMQSFCCSESLNESPSSRWIVNEFPKEIYIGQRMSGETHLFRVLTGILLPDHQPTAHEDKGLTEFLSTGVGLGEHD